MDLPRLSIWYLSPLKRCNFRCPYCVSGQPRIADRNEWTSEADPGNHRKVLEWISTLPFRVRLRMGSIGEPFTSDSYIDSLARLTHSENIEFLEILTNGSFSAARLGRLVDQAVAGKLRFWMTFHPRQIGLERFLQSALLAESRGVSIVAHGLLFPDTVQQMQELRDGCRRHGLRLHIGLGLNFNNAYPQSSGFVPILADPAAPAGALELSVGFAENVYKIAEAPVGAPCSAGHDYIYIDPAGNVHQCRTYSLDPTRRPVGSALDPAFRLELRSAPFAPCAAKTACVCTEDHQHLKVAHEAYAPDLVSFVPWSAAQFNGEEKTCPKKTGPAASQVASSSAIVS